MVLLQNAKNFLDRAYVLDIDYFHRWKEHILLNRNSGFNKGNQRTTLRYMKLYFPHKSS